MHRLVLDDDEADGHVADDARDEDADVQEGDRDQQGQTHIFWTEYLKRKRWKN